MPRKARLYQSAHSLTCHIINRGIIRQTIFHDQGDVEQFLSLIRRYQERFSFKLYHWSIMNNHYHLVIELLQSKSLPKIVGAIQQIYAVYHHRKYHTAGRLFQGRFKSQAIEKGNYLLACGRYIERNPLRAGLVELPWEWSWSSARYYALKEEDGITQPNPEWVGTGGNSGDYRRWLLEDNATKDEKAFRGSSVGIGSNEFMRQLRSMNGRLYPKGRGRPRK